MSTAPAAPVAIPTSPDGPLGSDPRRWLVHLVAEAALGGCETNCAVFIRHAPEFGHRVLVFDSPGPMTEVWQKQGAEVVHLGILARSWWSFGRALAAAVGRSRVDGIISWAGVRVPMQAWCLRHSGAAFLSYAGNPFVGSRRTRFALRLARWVLPAPPRVSVVACSDHVARSLAAAPYYAHLPQRRFLNPVEAPEVRVHRARTLVPAEGVRLGMVARLDPIKDHALLLRAFAVLRRNWPKAELHLAGDGVLRSQLEELAQSLGIAAAVRFHGAVRDVPAFLDRLDLFCYFTTPQEGMGSAFAEALARGLPSLANDLPVLREVAGAGATCATRFVATDAAAASEAMDGLLRDRTERERLSALGWERVRETFSPRSIVRGYLAALELRP